MFPVNFREVAHEGDARRGVATTHRGDYETPCFMPVGTRGAIRHLSAQDYEELGVRIVLGNTYHLMLRPGAQTVSQLGGLGAFAGWKGLTLTDSGGFQVFSLNPDVDDDGVSHLCHQIKGKGDIVQRNKARRCWFIDLKQMPNVTSRMVGADRTRTR